MTLDQTSSTTEGHKEVRSIPRMVASTGAPVAEPQRLRPDEAVSVARAARQERAKRDTPQTPSLEPEQIPALPPLPALPALPPAAHTPARLAPLALVLMEMAFDVIGIAGAFILAYWFRFKTDITPKFSEADNPTYATMLGVTLLTMIITFYFSRLYTLKRGASRVDEFYKIAAAVSMGTVLTLAINSLILGDNFVYSRQILLIGWLLAIIFVTVGRVIYSIIVGELRKHGVDRANVL